ncbi:hypothetical protein Bca52824_087666 [Brassica carinata]|uniref:Uncharacterized protein n=1 Tax=Brassica carinata TaxID=52824 RepID=A0A8X7PC18_BRACI|nr:hypothetical protein Bca52824_087666 [Brassica carinata]
MKLSHEIFAFDVVKDRNNPRRKKTSLIKLATMIEVSAKTTDFVITSTQACHLGTAGHLDTSSSSSAFLWVMRESIRSYLHSTKTSTITSSSSTLCNDQSRFIQRRVMKLVSGVKLHRFRRRSHRSAVKENRKKPGHFSARHGRIGKHRSQQLPVGWFMPARKPLPKTSLASAASESSRSSYYSLHMEGSGKLELRWESNITFWKSLRLYRGKARVFSSSSRARSITTPSSPQKQLQHLPEKRQSERELRRSYRNIRST